MKYLYSDRDDGAVRVAFRIYFICTLALLGLIGSQCCKCAAKLDLLHGKTVKIHRMTGWVRARDVLICLWKMHRLPGGWWLGLMMVTASFLTLTADLAVNALVRQQWRTDQCYFTQGLVVDWHNTETFSAPPANGYPALIVSNAQINSDSNLCSIGIYRKVPNTDDPFFCAGDTDIIGTWQCDDIQQDATVPSDYTIEQIRDFLYENGLQYGNATATYYINGLNRSTHYAAWSSSVDDEVAEPFKVLASVDLNITEQETKTIRTYKCSIATGPNYDVQAINDILSQMWSATTLDQWAPGLEGAIYTGAGTNASSDTPRVLALRLNSLTMVQGGSNSVLSDKLVEPDVPLYGCKVLKTAISPGIIILVLFAGLILCITALYWFILLSRLGKHALPNIFHRTNSGLRNLKPVPDSILGWMLQASRENALGGQYGEDRYLVGLPMKERDLQNWSFTVVDNGNGIARMVRSSGSVAPPVEQIQVYGK